MSDPKTFSDYLFYCDCENDECTCDFPLLAFHGVNIASAYKAYKSTYPEQDKFLTNIRHWGPYYLSNSDSFTHEEHEKRIDQFFDICHQKRDVRVEPRFFLTVKYGGVIIGQSPCRCRIHYVLADWRSSPTCQHKLCTYHGSFAKFDAKFICDLFHQQIAALGHGTVCAGQIQSLQ